MDPLETKFVGIFLAGEALGRSLVCMCSTAKHPVDPVAHVVMQAIESPVQVQLTRVGVQPFVGRDLTIPYNLMTPEQREFLLLVQRDVEAWHVYENAMVYRRSGARQTLQAVDVLEALCKEVLASKKFPDARARLALCNVILQRVQAKVAMTPGLQARLNERLWGSARPPRDV